MAGLLGTMGQAGARENQLAGVKLGGPSEQVTRLYGDPTRMMIGAPAGGAGGGMMGGASGGPGASGGEMGMPGGMGSPPGAMPGGPGMEGGMPGMGMPGMGMPGMSMAPGGGAAAALAKQKYEGKIAGMKPEEFVVRLLAPPAAAGAAGGVPGGMPGMPGMEGGMPGMPGMPGGMGGPGGPGAGLAPGQEAATPAITWIYENPHNPADCVTFVFGFNEDGRVSMVVVGDDKPYSTNRGGRKPPFQGAKTARGIGLGDSFKNVILAYGFPEATEVLGDEVLLKYFERHGVAFTFRQNFMKVTSITIKSPDE